MIKVPFSKKYNYAPYLNIDIGAESTCNDTKESFFAELDKLNEWCNEWFKTRYGEYEEQSGTTVKTISAVGSWNQPNEEPQEEVSVIDSINSCTELKVLESYKFIAKTKPEYQEAYDKKYRVLAIETLKND